MRSLTRLTPRSDRGPQSAKFPERPIARRRLGEIAALVPLLAAPLAAEPMQFRFEGVVSWSGWSLNGPVDSTGPYPTQPFSLTLELDLSKGGTVTHADQTVEPISQLNPPNSPYANAFHVSFVDGDRLRYTPGESTSLPNHEWAINYGVIIDSQPDQHLGALVAGGPNWLVIVSREVDPEIGVAGWQAGDLFNVKSSLHTGSGLGSEFSSPATLVSITPVPEPPAWALGIAGLGLWRLLQRRMQRTSDKA